MPNVNRHDLAKGDSAFYIPMPSAVAGDSVSAGVGAGACYVRAAVPRSRATLRGATAAAAAATLALASGCGGGARQDHGEAEATYPVAVPSASFPTRQSLAQHSEMRIVVRNIGNRTIPDVAATIQAAGGGTETEAFGRLTDASGVASRSRPAWVVDDGPLDGDTADANTWALGPLRPHATRTFVWRVSAVRAGDYVLTYRLAGSLTGRSQLRLGDGRVPRGSFRVHVSAKPATVRVTPSGKIVSVPG
jgi:hypothetical protein